MYIGNYAADSYYGARAYTTTTAFAVDTHAINAKVKADKCVAACPWWNPICKADCVAINGLGLMGARAQDSGNQALGGIADSINKGITGATTGGINAITPTVAMLGIAALGILTIVMVLR
jgi:hypothetical protein